MVIGTGLVGRSFSQYESSGDFLIFASGVSNSKACTPADMMREQDLLLSSVEKNRSKKIVYFSTTSIDDPDLKDTPYIKHKLGMEGLVTSHAPQFQIFRLSNLAGVSGNPHTILNYLYYSITNGKHFELWKYSERNIIGVEDAFQVADHILQHRLFENRTINIANDRNYSVGYIVKCIETHTGKKAIFTEKEKGGKFRIDLSDSLPVYKLLQIGFDEYYLPKLLEKYYPKK